MANVFAPITKRRNAKNPLYIGAVKANVGHGGVGADLLPNFRRRKSLWLSASWLGISAMGVVG